MVNLLCLKYQDSKPLFEGTYGALCKSGFPHSLKDWHLHCSRITFECTERSLKVNSMGQPWLTRTLGLGFLRHHCDISLPTTETTFTALSGARLGPQRSKCKKSGKRTLLPWHCLGNVRCTTICRPKRFICAMSPPPTHTHLPWVANNTISAELHLVLSQLIHTPSSFCKQET